MSKSHSDYLAIETGKERSGTTLRQERHETLRVLSCFVSDAYDSEVGGAYENMAALARRAYELGCRTVQQRVADSDMLAALAKKAEVHRQLVEQLSAPRPVRVLDTEAWDKAHGRHDIKIEPKGPRPYHRSGLDQWAVRHWGPPIDKALADALIHGRGAVRIMGVDLGVEDVGFCPDGKGTPVEKPSQEPCPHDRLDDEGAPPRKETDEEARASLLKRIAAATKAAAGA